LIHHPDKAAAGSDPAKFLSIRNAYECLSNADERAEYDQRRTKPKHNDGGGARRREDREETPINNYNDRRPVPPPGSARGAAERKAQSPPISISMEFSLEELYNGTKKKIDIECARSCGTCQGFVVISCSSSPITTALLHQ
jgi:DnaJ-class molecular chaperone